MDGQRPFDNYLCPSSGTYCKRRLLAHLQIYHILPLQYTTFYLYSFAVLHILVKGTYTQTSNTSEGVGLQKEQQESEETFALSTDVGVCATPYHLCASPTNLVRSVGVPCA